MRKFTFIILAVLGLPFGLIWAQDQGPVQKTEKTVKKTATDTGETIKKGTKATARNRYRRDDQERHKSYSANGRKRD